MTDLAPNDSKNIKYAPSRYMRDRHPDLFSDSVEEVEYQVSREILSYHLETLTNQKDETLFENFAQRLCEKFISPNIRPQTGPVGGGDGKTDAETHPVSAEISARWFVPNNEKSGERKAFAFSAKRDWRQKIKSDVKSIVGTERNYDHIFCVTNQFVPSKKSAELQDSLLRDHGTPVTILDRTWILDKVFLHESMDIAVEELGVGKGTEKKSKKLGPKDAARETELKDLDAEISDGSKFQGQPSELAEAARRSALLARGLEHPADEVNNRFERALRLARNNNLQKLQLTVTYEWAWTAHFWHEDHVRTSALYDDVEALALASEEADDLERLVNLLPLIRMSVHSGSIKSDVGKVEGRTAVLKQALKIVSEQQFRPNNALYAEALLLMVRVSEKGVEHRNDPLKDIWREFASVIRRAHGLGTFPFASIGNTLVQVGEFIADSAEFDELFEIITNALAERSAEGEAGTKTVQRAYQKLAKDLPFDAIRLFGRASRLLVKEEYQEDLINALLGSSFAFEAVGLPWAARNYALAALSQEFSDFRITGNVSSLRPSIVSRYYDTELQLGFVPQILNAHEMDIIVRSALTKTDGQRRSLINTQQQHMMQIGALLLQTPIAGLPNIAKLPDALERLGLPMSRTALLYLMGHEELLRSEGSIPDEETPSDTEHLLKSLHGYGVKAGYTTPPKFGFEDSIILSSNVLGCSIYLSCANNATSIGIGEAVLGSLEALLATSLDHRIMPRVDQLQLRVMPEPDRPLSPSLIFIDEDGEPVGIITHAPVMEYKTRDDVLSFPNWLKQAILDIFLRFAEPVDVKKWGQALFEDELALDRALTFSDIPTMKANIYGDHTRISVAHWIEPTDREYEIKRSTPWPQPDTKNKNGRSFADGKLGEGVVPDELRHDASAKHSAMRWVSPINTEKWSKAKWNGTIFMWSPDEVGAQPPILSLAFQNVKAARDIFTAWRKRYGDDDLHEDLLITIVRGIAIANPAAYAVMVSGNPANIPTEGSRTVGFISRINKMYPSSTRNLDLFLNEYDRYKQYTLMPSHLRNKQASPKPICELPISKRSLVVKYAWQIPPNDMTASVIDLDEPPYIPMDEPNAPVLKTMEWLKALRAGKA